MRAPPFETGRTNLLLVEVSLQLQAEGMGAQGTAKINEAGVAHIGKTVYSGHCVYVFKIRNLLRGGCEKPKPKVAQANQTRRQSQIDNDSDDHDFDKIDRTLTADSRCAFGS